jgi:hypothetical protein
MNSEVQSFDRKLMRLMKPFRHVKVAKVDPEREYLLHMGYVCKIWGRKTII